MASGGEMMAPSTKPTDHGRFISQCAAAATTTVVKATPPMERSPIGRRLKRNSRQLIWNAEV